MSRRMRFLLLSVAVAIPITAPAYGQTCEGTARSMTTETRHW